MLPQAGSCGAFIPSHLIPAPTERRGLDESVERLHEAARPFAKLHLGDRIGLARAMRAGYARTAPRSVELSCLAKRIVPGTPLEGEEWLLGPWPVLRHLRLLVEAMSAFGEHREAPLGRVGRTVDGRLSVEAFPGRLLDSLLLAGTRAEIHMRAAVGESDMRATRARFYKERSPGGVVLILAGGNAAAIPCHDLLTKLFNEGKVCLLKMHPVNAYLGPLLQQAFAAAVERDFLRIVYGGDDAGTYLALHPGVDEIHLTGSAASLDALLGAADQRVRARRAGDILIPGKPITSQLGNVSPVLIVPGTYLDRQLAGHAEWLAGALVQNAACNRTTPRLIVTPLGWPQRGAFLRHLEGALERAPLRMAFYPGALERWERLTENHPDGRCVGHPSAGMLPWTLISGLDPSDRGEPLFSTDAFCPIVAETSVGSPDPLEYLHHAVGFVNERVWGTLSASIVVHPRTMADRELGAAVERAVAQLRYGAVGINTWPALLSALVAPPWGAHPSSSAGDVQSGRGWIHNTAMLEDIEKTVLRRSPTFPARPHYAPGHRSAHRLGRRLAAVERGAGWAGLPGVLEAALRA
ncbi:MAG: aldehyde dehydrogenase family protein [Gemmatimonadales bacterium]